MKFNINPLILIFAFYAIGIISLFLPSPFFFGIIFFIPAVIGSIILYIRRIIRIYRERDEQNNPPVNEDLIKTPEKQLEKIKPVEDVKIQEIKYEAPVQKELITIEQIKEISSQVKEVIDDSKQCKNFISNVKLPVSSTTTVNVQITPEVFLVITVKPDEIVVYRHEPEVVEKKVETQKVAAKKTEIIKPEVIKPIEVPKPVEVIKTEPKKETKPLIIKSPKVTYDMIITTVLKGKGRMKAADALAQCKKIKDMKQWEKFLPMSNSRFGLPVIFSIVEENGIKIKYVEWVGSK